MLNASKPLADHAPARPARAAHPRADRKIRLVPSALGRVAECQHLVKLRRSGMSILLKPDFLPQSDRLMNALRLVNGRSGRF
jgi:hypothetical protein